MDKIIIKGARQHNLKNISLELPKNKLIVLTGISGSGKSSLAFDTIYAEGQRRYVESLSSYARQFLGVMDKPDVDSIEGLSPAISIDQKTTSHNPRSTVGTVTEIYDYLRLLFARIGHPHCPNCGREISKLAPAQIVDRIVALRLYRFFILSPIVRDRKGEFSGLLDNLRAKGFRQVRVDGKFIDLDEDIGLIKTNKHTIDVVIDRMSFLWKDRILPDVALRSRLNDAIEQSLNLSNGSVIVGQINDKGFEIPTKPKEITDHLFSSSYACPVCSIAMGEIEPRTFSFNSPQGACTECGGIGNILTVDPDLVINPILSISEGGILPFAKMFFHDTWYSRVISAVAEKYAIDLRSPLKNLTSQQRDVLLYGTGDTIHRVDGQNRFGEKTSIEEPFIGILAELKRRYHQSQSDYVKWEIEKYMRKEICTVCNGKRLKREALTVTIDDFSIADITDLSIADAISWHTHVQKSDLTQTEQTIAAPIVKEIKTRLSFLSAVGLEYLTLSRGAATLAGGEAQRIRLASQIGSGLSGVLYVLDEPSIGLHQRDNKKLIDTLKALRDLGNTVVVVEHDRDMIESADHIVDFGPGAGEHGGMVVASGTLSQILQSPKSLTASYLTGKRTISRDRNVRSAGTLSTLTLIGARQNNLKNITTQFPLGLFTCVSGVSGSGKSTLIVDTLYEALTAHFNPLSKTKPGLYTRIDGLENIDKVILIDQSPIGRTPRSNPATYTGIFSTIREVFASTSEARLRGYKAGRFSFNVRGGRCEACEGEGQKKIEMQFLSDIYVTCEVCKGTRFNNETLEVTFHDKSIAQVLGLTIDEAVDYFSFHGGLCEKLQTIRDVGLGYIHLGQPAPTLSGGEAQRVKLATELSRRATGKTVYILDEPTTGLHFADLEKLLAVLHRLTKLGNTVIIIEHNLDIIKNADWIVDLGPEGGERGGFVVAYGTPRDISRVKTSYTGQFLRKIIE
ncbi:MAG: UvrABC system protein A [Candidatus Gottesmanbacteria bacterium GW2011_GWA1_47_8]|uniref:UvrABC system protein A n=1 Tax=Candidatus Gottesmanbacteria bacterium GW2011_GWA1_47_8 TaxID=1618438 RepID=A0A0G1WFG2_9BACT|nr:MAG: UvrABC system protein A [Candidatus Gottesmanbacteria bacterium GW2011_GWA1_47_8]